MSSTTAKPPKGGGTKTLGPDQEFNSGVNAIMLSIDVLVPTPDNPRALRADDAFKQLVSSIGKLGILHPLIARPMPGEFQAPTPSCPDGGPYDLRCGHRRLEAARQAGLIRVPVIVREMDDKTALEITLAENLQRENLTPLEESAAMQHLLDVGWAVAEIADRMGRTPAWIARRARLQNLSKAWRQEAAKEGSVVCACSAPLLERIAILPADTQALVLELMESDQFEVDFHWYHQADRTKICPSPAEIDAYLAGDILHTLSAAPWKVDDETLAPKAGACTTCPKRSSCEPLLFKGLNVAGKGKQTKKAAGQDRCLDIACFAENIWLFIHKRLHELKKEHGEVTKEFPGIAGADELDTSTRRTVGAKPAVIVTGPRAGQAVRMLSLKNDPLSGSKPKKSMRIRKPKPPAKARPPRKPKASAE